MAVPCAGAGTNVAPEVVVTGKPEVANSLPCEGWGKERGRGGAVTPPELELAATMLVPVVARTPAVVVDVELPEAAVTVARGGAEYTTEAGARLGTATRGGADVNDGVGAGASVCDDTDPGPDTATPGAPVTRRGGAVEAASCGRLCDTNVVPAAIVVAVPGAVVLSVVLVVEGELVVEENGGG